MKNTSVILVMFVLLLLGFFSSDFSGGKGYTGIAIGQHIFISDVSCTWQDDHYEACMHVDWSSVSGGYAQSFFSGGVPLSRTPHHNGVVYMFCDDVGPSSRLVNGGVYVYGARDDVVALNKNVVANCKHTESDGSVFRKKIQFTAFKSVGLRQRPDGNGEIPITLPFNPDYCEVQGTWETVSRREQNVGSPTTHCDGASGVFSGYVDQGIQYNFNDPGVFRWAGSREPALDPGETQENGYLLSMKTCDSQYYTSIGPRYYTRMWIDSFGRDMDLRWDYFDDAYQVAVDVSFDLVCVREELPPRPRVVIENPALFFPPPPVAEEPEVFQVSVEELVVEDSSWWSSVSRWFSGFFF
jgi:hypothetical protein